MKYLLFFKLFDVIKHISALNISLTHLSAADYNEIYKEQAQSSILRNNRDDITRMKTWNGSPSEANQFYNNMNTKLRRKKRLYSVSTIDRMSEKQKFDLALHRQNVHEHQNCQENPCQKRPFIISYEVGTPTQ